LCKTDDVHSSDDTLPIFIGQNLHTTHTKAIFPETRFHQEAFDNDGKLLQSKFPPYTHSDNKGSTWECANDLCKLPPAIEVTGEITIIPALVYVLLSRLDTTYVT